MKKLLLGLLMTLGLATQASHLAGGDIQYRYIGDSTGITRHYKVILRLYRDVTGIGLPTTETVTVSSGCYANINVTVNLTPGSGVVSPTLFDCVTPGPTNKTLEVYSYVGYVILPGNCADYAFWYENCCRPPGITNVAGSSGLGFYFDAKLNNTQGQNSSPVFVSEPVRAFCVGNTFNWKQTAIEADGDSVRYSLINCRQNVYPNQTNIPYLPGWTTQQPVTSSQFNLNQSTGQITFTPTAAEIDVLSILVEEWRFDSLNQWWYPIGTSSRDMMISVSPACNSTAMSGVQYDPNTYATDSITGHPMVEVACGDTSFTLKFHIALDCYSINDVDFRMTNTNNNQPKAIKTLWSECNVNQETDSIRVVMLTAFNQAGRYYLYSKKGNDGNTLINKCGIPMNEFDTIVVVVGPCPPPPPPPPIGEIDSPLEGQEPTRSPGVPTPTPFFPNVITPNADGRNDFFTIRNAEQFTSIKLTIFNRWGEPVYQTDTYTNDFGGTVKLSDGVYFYTTELYFQPNDVTLKHSGTLTVLK